MPKVEKERYGKIHVTLRHGIHSKQNVAISKTFTGKMKVQKTCDSHKSINMLNYYKI